MTGASERGTQRPQEIVARIPEIQKDDTSKTIFSRGITSSHPINVSATESDMEGCTRTNCVLFGMGLIEIKRGHGTRINGRIFLAATGCTKCDVPNVTQGDIGVQMSFTANLLNTPTAVMYQDAAGILAARVQRFVE